MTQAIELAINEKVARSFRAEFPIFDHNTYLNSCSLGPLSRDAFAALERYRDDWSEYGAPAWWKKWIPQLNEARDLFASLIGAEPHEVTINHSISSALSSISSTFDYRERNAVVCADLDFPTIPYQWLAKARQGVKVRYAHSHDRIRAPVEAFEEVTDSAVAHIVTSHVFYSTGYLQPIRRLADLAHAHGARIIVDGYHAVGVTPVNVKELDVDFYVGGTLKWLCGGPGLTFIYVRPELIPELEPTITGWFASAQQFAFDSMNLDWAPSADRLELGTPSVPTAYAGVAGMELIQRADPDAIYPRIQYLTGLVVERARRAGYSIMSPERADERGGIVMLRLDQPEATVEALSEAGFTVDYRPGLVRVSPHFFNTEEDIDRLMAEIDRIQRGE